MNKYHSSLPLLPLHFTSAEYYFLATFLFLNFLVSPVTSSKVKVAVNQSIANKSYYLILTLLILYLSYFACQVSFYFFTSLFFPLCLSQTGNTFKRSIYQSINQKQTSLPHSSLYFYFPHQSKFFYSVFSLSFSFTNQTSNTFKGQGVNA